MLALPGAWAAGAIQVRVTDETGAVVPGAHVSTAGAGPAVECLTSDQGICELDLSPAPALRLAISKEGFRAVHAAGSQETVAVALLPDLVRSSITVVSGSRREELQDESPVKVEAISRAEIQSTGYERVSDVLSEVPGVVVRSGSTATVGGEQIQGINSRQVLVLQDGLPIVGARGIKSGNINLNRQSVGRLNRIEVAKGAGSSLYGSDAVGGVINMITREVSNPVEGGLSLSGGSLGAVYFRGDIGGRYRNLSAFLNLETHRQDSYQLVPASPTTVGPDFRRNDLLFKTRYQVAPQWALGFTANAYHNREEGRNLSETGPVAGLANDSTQSYALISDWTLTPSTLLQARAYLARYDENGTTTPLGQPQSPAYSNLNERYRRLDATLSRQFSHGHFVQGGAEWAQNQYRGANRLVGDNAGVQITSNDFWVQDKWLPHPRVTLSLGGRVTHHSLFGSAAVPKIGLNVRLSERWSGRASWGQGFRAPDLGQLYYRFANPASFYQVIGNPNLRPEHSASWQTGVTFRANRFRGGLTLFRNDVRDLIDSFDVGPPASAAQLTDLLARYGIPADFNPLLNRRTFVYFNQSRIYTQGFELDGNVAIQRNWRAGGGYTFLRHKDRVTGLPLAQRHRHQGFVRMDYARPRWGLATNLRGTFFSHWLLNPAAGTRGLGYQIWDAFLSKELPHGVQLFASVDNLNNSRDEKLGMATPAFDRPDYGRTWRAGLRYQFRRSE
jgi:outer membrane receptor for ferrienterochelin and colicins